MESVEHVAMPPHNDLSPIAKGKRTKRQRTHSPIPFTTRPPTPNHKRIPSFSASSNSEDDSTTTEEEDTARCLILLAQGGHFQNYRSQKINRYVENTTLAKPACMYTCKTCNRAFASFQALGGHRASHKKHKNEKKSYMFSDEEDFPSPSSMSSSFKNRLSLQLSNISTANLSGIPKASPSPRTHECSYCGAEFTSGQALGGHMRRHRGSGPVSPSVTTPPTPIELKNTRNFLSLDLNLPAPEEENHRFGFSGPRPLQMKSPEEKRIAFSTTTTSSLLDCHY